MAAVTLTGEISLLVWLLEMNLKIIKEHSFLKPLMVKLYQCSLVSENKKINIKLTVKILVWTTLSTSLQI